MDWKTVQVSAVDEVHLIRLSKFANHIKCPAAELQSAAKSDFKTSKKCHFTLLEIKSVSPFCGCAIDIYLKINILGVLCFSLQKV